MALHRALTQSGMDNHGAPCTLGGMPALSDSPGVDSLGAATVQPAALSGQSVAAV
jgi:hypothetical protein